MKSQNFLCFFTLFPFFFALVFSSATKKRKQAERKEKMKKKKKFERKIFFRFFFVLLELVVRIFFFPFGVRFANFSLSFLFGKPCDNKFTWFSGFEIPWNLNFFNRILTIFMISDHRKCVSEFDLEAFLIGEFNVFFFSVLGTGPLSKFSFLLFVPNRFFFFFRFIYFRSSVKILLLKSFTWMLHCLFASFI